jgi:hypothetical protein
MYELVVKGRYIQIPPKVLSIVLFAEKEEKPALPSGQLPLALLTDVIGETVSDVRAFVFSSC